MGGTTQTGFICSVDIKQTLGKGCVETVDLDVSWRCSFDEVKSSIEVQHSLSKAIIFRYL